MFSIFFFFEQKENSNKPERQKNQRFIMTTLSFAEEIAALTALGHDLLTATHLAKEDREKRFALAQGTR